MSRFSTPFKISRLALLFALSTLGIAAASAVAGDISADHDGKKGLVKISVDGKPFTTLIYKGRNKPVLYPVYGPDQKPMTRSYPIVKGVKGEATDHPHHESIWFTHGSVSGENFWHIAKESAKVVTVGEPKVTTTSKGGVASATIASKNKWVAKDGKRVVCTDDTVIVCTQHKDGTRTIDYTVTIHASEVDITFQDDKEGTMGIRTHPNLRLAGGKGVTDHNGQAINAAGGKGKGIWGKKAAWVAYWGKIPKGGDTYGIAIFDHPTNLRHPTTWHARTYGLVAANPFGLSHFTGKRKSNPKLGDFKLAKGKSQRFKYRFVFHKGDPKSVKIADQFKDWASEND